MTSEGPILKTWWLTTEALGVAILSGNKRECWSVWVSVLLFLQSVLVNFSEESVSGCLNVK